MSGAQHRPLWIPSNIDSNVHILHPSEMSKFEKNGNLIHLKE